MDARIFRIKSSAHRVTPMAVKTMPAMGRSGMMGQRMISTRLTIPPTMITKMPTKSKIRREKKPTMREIKRSKNIWNLISKEAPSPATSAEIWR